MKKTIVIGAVGLAMTVGMTSTASARAEQQRPSLDQIKERVASRSARVTEQIEERIEQRVQNREERQATASAQRREAVRERMEERLKQGAQFSYTDGKVTVTTPSGNTHQLNLPPQAIENMRENGFFNKPLDSTQSAVVGEVKEKRKFLGILPVSMNMNVEVNPETGAVTYQPKSAFAKLFFGLFKI